MMRLRRRDVAWVTVASWIVALAPLCSSPPAPAHALRVPTSVDAPADSSADLVAAGPVTNCVPDARFVTNAGSAIRTTAATASITVTPALTSTGLLTGTSAISVTYPLSRASALTGSLSRLVALSATNVWALGSTSPGGGQLIWHWDGQRWSAVPNPPPPYHYDPAIFDPSRYDTDLYEYQLMGLTALSAENLWAVGTVIDVSNATHVKDRPLIEHWNGTRWRIVPSPKPRNGHGYYLRDVAGLSSADVWAVGSAVGGLKTLVEHWDGRRWRLIPSPSPAASNLQGVAVLSRRNVWAVGSTSAGSHTTALIEHWDGRHWRVIPSPNVPGSNDRLSAIAAVSAQDLWATGSASVRMGTIPLFEHWNGRAWSIVAGPTVSGSFAALTAVSAYDVWAVGDAGIAHWAGQQWRSVPYRGGYPTTVTMVSPHDIWVGVDIFITPPGEFVVEAYADASCVVADPPHVRTVHAAPYGHLEVVDQATSRAFVDGEYGTITVLDTAREKVVRTVNVCSAVSEMSVDNWHGIVVVVCFQPERTVLLDARSGAVLSRIDGPDVQESGFDHIVATAQSLFLSDSTQVSVVEPTMGRILNALAITDTTDMVADDQSGRMFITNLTGTVMVSAATGAVLKTFAGLSGSIAVDQQSNHVFIVQPPPRGTSFGSRIVILDGTTGATLGALDFGDRADITIRAAQEGRLFVNSDALHFPYSELSILDAATGSLLSSVAPSNAGWVLYDKRANRFITVLPYYGIMELFDTATGALLTYADLSCGTLSVPPVLDERTSHLFIVCPPYVDKNSRSFGDPFVRVVDAATGEWLATLPLASAPSALALDAATGHVFVLDESGTVTAFDAGLGTARHV